MTTADECLPFQLDQFTEYVENVKAEHVIAWKADVGDVDPNSEPDIVPCCHMTWDDLETSLLIIAPEMNVNAILWAVHALGGVTAPTSVTLVSDAKIAGSWTNPTTGQPWAPGELASSDAADGLLLATVWRNGRRRHTTRPYVADKYSGTLVWADPTHLDTGNGNNLSDIPLLDRLHETMQCECAAPVAALADAMGLDREYTVKHSLAALMPKLAEKGFMQALGSNNTSLAEYIATSVPGSVQG